MLFAFVFDVNEDVIKIYYYKNIKLLYEDLVDVALKRSWHISQSKRHHLILKMAIAGPEDRFLFIIFADLYSMIDISQIKLNKMLDPI